ncbi:Signal transduction histidine-protein kinase BarA [Novipirellula aureliae]|uniref:Sensory/regulatory protein RpfC n=1 Tax=Novipirellula aureliae TaxID=2527966 RepID=A0A5C6E1G9_9BACT|nr:response regulator [Novipirellula aureliae]TWU43503.1 Signal transduction histidine-protein kinase BarA [Novipirellula aureliae]
MAERPFQIRLSDRPLRNIVVAEFPATRSSDARHMSRRARVLSALTGLSARQRAAFAKSVAEACRAVAAAEISASVRFRVAATDEGTLAQVEVAATDAGGHLPPSAWAAIQAQAESLHTLRLTEQPLTITLGQLAPRSCRLSDEDVAHWTELLDTDSLEDAIAIAQSARKQSTSELGIARSHGPSEEATRQARSDREDLETLSLVVSRSPIATLVMSDDGSIQWVNNAFVNLSGYSEAEVVGRRCDELLFGPSTDTKAVRRFHQSLRNGHEMQEDVMLYRRDGRTTWVDFRLIPIHDRDGKLSRWIGIQTDVTKRRQTEEALQAAKQSAEMGSRAKSEFLANMSHEIRTPLNAVVGMTELALATDLTSEQRDYLQCVQSSADTLLDLLNDVLDVSKIEAGKMEIESVVFNIAELIRETLQALAVKAHEKNLELAVHMPMDIPPFMQGDPTRIRQVLFNLVGNAIKFTEHGEVVVEVEQQWATDDEVCLHFAIHDTGVGIPRERLRKIFESFTQVDSSMARRFGGTGLGLTITSELIRMMDGKIWVQSKLGKGSTFHVTMTLKSAQPPEAAAGAVDAEQLAGKTALVVDDNATNRRILDEMLKNWGVHTTLADGADNALVELSDATQAGHPFDLILLDARMPRADGFQLAETIKNRQDLACGTVVMLSSADRPNSAARCRQLGIETYLVKPVSASSLLEAIMASVEHQNSKSFDGDVTTANGAPAIKDQAEKQLRVLVVDDHGPNRQLAISILQRRGHVCEAAEDGDEAVKAFSRQAFDLILMDVQMPGIDGFTATKRIREREKSTGTHTPIVALTAHALSGDREKCLAAGMDSYLAKPIHARQLVALVEQLIRDGQAVAARDDFEQPDRATPAFSIPAALDRMNGELDLLIEHIGYVINDTPQLLHTIRKAIEETDAKSLEIASHRLKSLVGTYSHAEAQELAYALELMGKNESFEDTNETLQRLESQIAAFLIAIRQYAQAQTSHV